MKLTNSNTLLSHDEEIRLVAEDPNEKRPKTSRGNGAQEEDPFSGGVATLPVPDPSGAIQGVWVFLFFAYLCFGFRL